MLVHFFFFSSGRPARRSQYKKYVHYQRNSVPMENSEAYMYGGTMVVLGTVLLARRPTRPAIQFPSQAMCTCVM